MSISQVHDVAQMPMDVDSLLQENPDPKRPNLADIATSFVQFSNIPNGFEVIEDQRNMIYLLLHFYRCTWFI